MQVEPALRRCARLTPPDVDFALPADVIAYFRDAGGRRPLRKGTVIEQEGEPCRAFWILLAGELRVYSSESSGKQFTINTILPGESVGETIVAGGIRNSSIRAEIDSEVIEVSSDQLAAAIGLYPDFALLMIRRLSLVVRGLCDRVKALALDDVYGRVVRLILESSYVAAGVRRAPKLSHGEMARRVGASRSMVNRVMSELVEGGYVELNGTEIDVRKQFPARW